MSEGSGVWYVRARGRILGPFSWSQLQGLRDRGQLVGFHEVSRDKQNWSGAASLTELFGAATSAAPGGSHAVSSVSVATPVAEDWYYNQGGSAAGPISAQRLVSYIRAGQITADTLVWKDGLPTWLPVRNLPELVPFLPAPAGVGATNPGAYASSLAAPAVAVGAPAGRGWQWVLGIAAGAVLLVLLGAAAFVLADWYRRGEWRAAGTGHTPYVNSQTSVEIPRAIGLVVAAASVTNLKTGEMIEVPGSRGTCFALSPSGYLLTNRHVVDEYVKLTRADAKIDEIVQKQQCRIKPRLWVYFAKEKYEAKVVHMNTKYDIAILKVEREGPYFRLCTRPKIVQGTHIFALGFPVASSEPLSVEGAVQRGARKLSETVESVLDESDYRYSITDGIVSLLRSELGVEYIQHSASISGGNSGGPLIYDDGSVLGVNTLVAFDKEKPGVGVKYYAVNLRQVVKELSRNIPDLDLE
jgi:S1-C subfamily serine protease